MSLDPTQSADFDNSVKLALYGITAESGRIPGIDAVVARVAAIPAAVKEAYLRLRARRLLWLEADGVTVRMAPPFSGVPSQHRVVVDGIEYYANCAWDALGIPAALHRPGLVRSRCEQSLAPLDLHVGLEGPEPSRWLFHCLVPAAKWWDDLVFT
jgi:hypothetical protein